MVNFEGKHVIITMNTGAKYMGIYHKSSDSKIVLSELCVLMKSGGSAMSGSNEKRVFLTEKIKSVELIKEKMND